MKKRIKSFKEDNNYVMSKKSWRFLSGTITLIFSVLFMFLTVSTVLVKAVPPYSFINIVSGTSMDPTLHDGQFMFATDESIKRGDIVVSHFPQELIDANPEDESYLTDEHKKSTYIEGKYYHVELNSNQYFIMGDNRDDSYDSRYFGAVNIGDIAGVQSTSPTNQTFIKSIYIILYILLIVLAYKLIDFVVVEVFYKTVSKNK